MKMKCNGCLEENKEEYISKLCKECSDNMDDNIVDDGIDWENQNES